MAAPQALNSRENTTADRVWDGVPTSEKREWRAIPPACGIEYRCFNEC